MMKKRKLKEAIRISTKVKAGGWECMDGVSVDVGWGNGQTVRETLPCYGSREDNLYYKGHP